MKSRDVEERIIEQYQQDERMMILVFAQWCMNHDLDPLSVYQEAYPNQPKNESLVEVLELMVPKEESGEIPDQTIIDLLVAYGNEDLAFVVMKEIVRKNRK
ncbi:hypothetical protein [Tepidibacillus marianensis]|uniref:hypothetical protein n=1 Tax=Tepidibacillus marianensis TaxID=3131995 RepID=UPI0030CD4F63